MNFLYDCLKGIAIGSGAILPGVSSGVFLVIFGIYEKFLDCILNFFKNPKESIKFLFPYIVGISIGILLFSNILNYFFNEFPIQSKSIFIGLILGGLPKLIKETLLRVSFKLKYLIYTLFSLLIGVLLVILENNINVSTANDFETWYLILAGFAMSIGVIIPGVSSTVILMLLGVYSTYLYSISTVNLPVLIPMGIGLAFGAIVFMKLTNYLLKHFYAQTFYSIIGFSIGSILVLMPSIGFNLNLLISILCIILGFIFFV